MKSQSIARTPEMRSFIKLLNRGPFISSVKLRLSGENGMDGWRWKWKYHIISRLKKEKTAAQYTSITEEEKRTWAANEFEEESEKDEGEQVPLIASLFVRLQSLEMESGGLSKGSRSWAWPQPTAQLLWLITATLASEFPLF